jgi:hypothetical protein
MYSYSTDRYIYIGYAGAIGMLLNINGKFTIKDSFG